MDPIMFPERRKSRGTPPPEQDSLFGDPSPVRPRKAPYQPSSETSREAADKIAPHAAKMCEAVYVAIRNAGVLGATRKELEFFTGFLTQTLCARLVDLERAGRIRKAYLLKDGKAELQKRDSCAIYQAIA